MNDPSALGADKVLVYLTSFRVSVATKTIPSGFMSHKIPIICGRNSSLPTANMVFSIPFNICSVGQVNEIAFSAPDSASFAGNSLPFIAINDELPLE